MPPNRPLSRAIAAARRRSSTTAPTGGPYRATNRRFIVRKKNGGHEYQRIPVGGEKEEPFRQEQRELTSFAEKELRSKGLVTGKGSELFANRGADQRGKKRA